MKEQIKKELETKQKELYEELEVNKNIIKRIYSLQDRISKTIESYPKFLDDDINKNIMIKHQETSFYYFDIAKLIKENDSESYKELKAAVCGLEYFKNNNLHIFLLKNSEQYKNLVFKMCKGDLFNIFRKITKINEAIATIGNHISQYDYIERQYQEMSIEHNTLCKDFLEKIKKELTK